jgi:mannose-6-phosphate isomerase-like protein (cupin superfamily)
MAIDLYQGFTNNKTGESFQCISFDKNSFRFDWVVAPGGYVPFEHVHLKQDEIFHVNSGEMKIRIADKDHIIGEGQSFRVPKGTPHVAYNNKPSLLHCDVEYTPGLDSYYFFQCFGGLTLDKDTSRNGTVNIPYFTRKMKAQCITRPTQIPAPFFYVALNFFFIVGTISGWRKQFEKYTGGDLKSLSH